MSQPKRADHNYGDIPKRSLITQVKGWVVSESFRPSTIGCISLIFLVIAFAICGMNSVIEAYFESMEASR